MVKSILSMKNLFTLFLLIMFIPFLKAQSGYIGIGTANPLDKLHIDSGAVGTLNTMRIDDLRLNRDGYSPSTATLPLVNKAVVIVDLSTGRLYSYPENKGYWTTFGNTNIITPPVVGSCIGVQAGTMSTSGYNFIGTRDATDLIFATNDRERGRFLDNGQFVIYGGNTSVPASSPTGCIPAYDAATDISSFYGTGTNYPLNAYSENSPAVYGSSIGNAGAKGIDGIAAAVNGSWTTRPIGVRGYNTDARGTGVYGVSANSSTSPTSGYRGVWGVESTLAGYGVYCTGDMNYTGTLYNISDAKLKENIKPYSGAIDILKKLNPVTYNFKKEFYSYGVPKVEQIGLIAQEVEQVLPNFVKQSELSKPDYSTKDTGKASDKQAPKKEDIDIKVLNYEGLIPILVQAVKEQQSQIEDLRKQISELKAGKN